MVDFLSLTTTYVYHLHLIVGEIERTFLVLREKGAMARQQIRDQRGAPSSGATSQDPPPAPAPEPEAQDNRGLKRDASQDAGTPSKRQH